MKNQLISRYPSIMQWCSAFVVIVQSLGHVQSFATPWTVACQAPLSMGFSRPRILEWVAFPFSRGTFPTPGSNPGLPHCRQILYHLSHKGEEFYKSKTLKFFHADLTEGESKLLHGSQGPIKPGFIAPVISSPSTHLPARSGLIMGCGLRMWFDTKGD